MNIVFFGSGAFARPTLQWLAQSGHGIAAVVTQTAKGSGRGQRVVRTPVGALAAELGLTLREAEDVNAADFLRDLAAMKADLGLVIAFGQKLGPQLLGTFPFGCVNLHASLLPKYRGAAPIHWAIIRGEAETGCTVFKIVERMDAGPVLVTRSTMIKPDETAGELHDRLAAVGVDAVRAALELYAGGAEPKMTPQDEALATKAPKLKKELGVIDFDKPARDVAQHIRGVTPWPGAQTRFESREGRWENVNIVRARAAEATGYAIDAPGRLDARLFASTADGFLEILEVQPSSGRLMSWRDYVNGRHVAAGDRFVTA
jgi:methionyl-tRNA formyltransferase